MSIWDLFFEHCLFSFFKQRYYMGTDMDTKTEKTPLNNKQNTNPYVLYQKRDLRLD